MKKSLLDFGIDKKTNGRILKTDLPDYPLDAINVLAEKIAGSKELSAFLIEQLKCWQDGCFDDDYYLWILFALGCAGSLDAVPVMISFLADENDRPFEEEDVVQSLVLMGAEAVEVVLNNFKHDLDWNSKNFLSGYMEMVPHFGDDQLTKKCRDFLMEFIEKESEVNDENACVESMLSSFVEYPGEDNHIFAGKIISKYEYSPNLDEIYSISTGRLDLGEEPFFSFDLESACRRIANRFSPPSGKYPAPKDIKNDLKRLDKALNNKDYQKVLEISSVHAEFPSSSPVFLFNQCNALHCLGRKKEMLEVAVRSLDKLEEHWLLFPEKSLYETILILKIMIADVLEDESEFDDAFLSVLFDGYCDILSGILRIRGAVKVSAVDTFIKERDSHLFRLFEPIKTALLTGGLKKEDCFFTVIGDYFVLKEVSEPEQLVSIHENLHNSDYLPETISEAVLWSERREYFLYSMEMREADLRIRVLTTNKWNLSLFREEMMNDLDGDSGLNGLINKLQVYFNDIEELTDLVYYASAYTPRWGLGGRSKDEVRNMFRQLTQDKKKVGRNDPCPCGSGKKYKKCCLNTFER